MENQLKIQNKRNFILDYICNCCTNKQLISLYNQSCKDLHKYDDMIRLNSDKFIEFELGDTYDNLKNNIFLLQYNIKDPYVVIDKFENYITYPNEEEVVYNVDIPSMIINNLNNLYIRFDINDKYEDYVSKKLNQFKEIVSEDEFKATINKFIKGSDNSISEIILENYSDYLNEENKNINDQIL